MGRSFDQQASCKTLTVMAVREPGAASRHMAGIRSLISARQSEGPTYKVKATVNTAEAARSWDLMGIPPLMGGKSPDVIIDMIRGMKSGMETAFQAASQYLYITSSRDKGLAVARHYSSHGAVCTGHLRR
jgi:hypothetical protein